MSADVGTELFRSKATFTSLMKAHREIVSVMIREAEGALSTATGANGADFCRHNLAKASEALAVALRTVNSLQQALNDHSQIDG
jgi:hypothetical protein